MPASAPRARSGGPRQRALGRVVIGVERELRKRLGLPVLGRRAGRAVPGSGGHAARPRNRHDVRRTSRWPTPRRHATPPSTCTCARRLTSAGAAAARPGRTTRSPSGPESGLSGVGTPDRDGLRIEGDGHRPVPGPVLRVDGVVGHRGVEPQPVAFAAVVEGGLVSLARGAVPLASATTTPSAPWSSVSLAVVPVAPARPPPTAPGPGRRPRPLRSSSSDAVAAAGRRGLRRLRLRGRAAFTLGRLGAGVLVLLLLLLLGLLVVLGAGLGGGTDMASAGRPRGPSSPPSRSCSRLKRASSSTETSILWAIQASVRPWRTHMRIWFS